MSKRAVILLTVLCIARAVFCEDAPSTDKSATFTLAPGYTAQYVAGPPLVERPIMACYDDRGRLFVADSAGVNLNAKELMKDPPHSIKMLEDTNGDGVFDKSTVFADKLTFPMGVLWYRGCIYTCSPPSLWKLSDTDFDGVADKREELVTKFGSIGNAADIHGPTLGPDGWIYWVHGRHGHEIAKPDGTTIRGLLARVFRCRPDGRDVEVVCGGGMDNPVELAFTPEGEALTTVALFHAIPKRVDVIMHCVEGGAFPRADMFKEFRRTGELLPAVSNLGWVAPSGFMRYKSAGDSPDSNTYFTAQFNVHKIQKHTISRDGATFKSRDEDFLVSTDNDVHFTDVLEDADGSLLALDTGGWFRIGCPTSRVAKPDIKGAIYRIRKTGAPKISDPRGANLGMLQPRKGYLADLLLGNSRFFIRDMVIDQLEALGDAGFDELKIALAHPNVMARRNAVWMLARVENDRSRELIRSAMDDKDASVRHAAVHIVGLNRDAKGLSRLIEIVKSDPPELRREAATGLGRIRDKTAVPVLLESLKTAGGDRFLEHSLIYALMEINDADALVKALSDENSTVRRAALIALDQTGNSALTAESVAALLDPADSALQQTALKVIQSHEGWGKQVQSLVKQWLGAEDLNEPQRENLHATVVAFSRDSAMQDAVALALRSEKTPQPTRLALIDAIARAPLDPLPATWAAELRWSLDSVDSLIVRQALAALRSRNVLDFSDAALRLAIDPQRPVELRLDAAGLAAPRLNSIDSKLFGFLVENLQPELPPLQRMAAAGALGSAPLSDGQLTSLCKNVETAGALELSRLVAAYERSKREDVGRKLLKALSAAKALKSLTPDNLQRSARNFPEPVRKEIEALAEKLDANSEEQKAKMTEFAGVLTGGDASRGRDVFFSARASCYLCHAVQDQGGRSGPDLSRIGGIRSERDLLESIIFPSNSFARGYEPVTIKDNAGAIFAGIISRETPNAIFAYGSDRVEKRFARAAVAEIKPSAVSVMPQSMETLISRQELADLIAWLKSLK